jgi:aldehyde dehydrogenase (NAD+)|tara:strand:- start:35223 stop:36599 length:1377 start_codon:yes stop_codon:yes gene_type:complete
MQETSQDIIQAIYKRQQSYFATNCTKNVDFRINQLKKFKNSIEKYQKQIEEALWLDLHKSPEEAYLTEISIVLTEIKNHLKHIKSWSKTNRVPTPLFLQPSSSRIIYEPLGLTLIIAPWNYPFQLTMNPLIGAISSGCCAILKPSPDTSAIAKVMEKIIAETFDPEYICLVQGGRETNTYLLQERFDSIFFTGSSRVGKIVMKAAAENLTPVVLELGGKSPCIVEKEANIDIAAKRIIWGKLINGGQTCIAPDYVYVHSSIKEKLLQKMVEHLTDMYGSNIKESRFYPRIVNEQALLRLEGLMNEGTIYYGGEVDKAEKYISPTILDGITIDHAIMQEEIFGPLLPILTFEKIDEVIDYVNSKEKPLALYYFGDKTKSAYVLARTSSGGVCVNDILMHITNHHLPFGGVGNSGVGKYHGKESFLIFSNQKAIVSSLTWIDLPFKYIPFKWFKLMKKIL